MVDSGKYLYVLEMVCAHSWKHINSSQFPTHSLRSIHHLSLQSLFSTHPTSKHGSMTAMVPHHNQIKKLCPPPYPRWHSTQQILWLLIGLLQPNSFPNTKSCSQWFGILKVAKLYAFQSVTKLVFQKLSNLVDNMDTDTNQDMDSITSQTSQSIKYHTTSEGTLPQPPVPTPKCIPHPNHPIGVNQEGVPYFLAHSTKCVMTSDYI